MISFLLALDKETKQISIHLHTYIACLVELLWVIEYRHLSTYYTSNLFLAMPNEGAHKKTELR